ncbi:hypothetical protein [Rhodobacter capsulatus]|uniref:hypothetical protein n=1 Tax=Rhodobacter capsulatus TaxID=1061 RepID=UPI0040288431
MKAQFFVPGQGGEILRRVQLANLPEAGDLAAFLEVEGGEMFGLIVEDDAQNLQGYAVFALDNSEPERMLAIHFARVLQSVPQLARVVLQSLIGAAQIAGVPVRMHSDRVKALARMAGAAAFAETLDGLGEPAAVIYGEAVELVEAAG